MDSGSEEEKEKLRHQMVEVEDWIQRNEIPIAVMEQDVVSMIRKWENYNIPTKLIYIELMHVIGNGTMDIWKEHLSDEEKTEAERIIALLKVRSKEIQEKRKASGSDDLMKAIGDAVSKALGKG